MFDNYVVLEGDTIEDIANKFSTTVDILKKLNGDNLDIYVGNMIMVPKNVNNIFDYYIINKGDTLYKIATDNNINPKLLAELNGINIDDYIYPNQVLLIPRPGSILYITAVGDTLNEIASGIGADIVKLIEQNGNIYLQPEQLIVYRNK